MAKEKVTQQGSQARNGTTTHGYAEGLDQLQQEAVVHISPLPAQQPRPASSQSITGPITGERPCSRTLSVMGKDESQPQSTPPPADHHQQPQILTNIVSPLARADTPQVPFKTISQISGLHLSQLSAPLFTEDKYSTSTDNNEENCDAEITTITRQQMPSQATMVMLPTRSVSTPSMADYSTQGDPNQMATTRKPWV